MAYANLEDDLSSLRWVPDPVRPTVNRDLVVYWHTAGSSRRASQEGAKSGYRARGLLTGFSAIGLLCRRATQKGAKDGQAGARTWIWEYRTKDGKKHRRQYGSPDGDNSMSFAEARRQADMDRVTLEHGHDVAPQEAPAVAHTVDDLFAEYLHHLETTPRLKSKVMRRPRYVRKTAGQIAPFRKAFGHRDIAGIKRGEVVAFLDRYLDRPSSLRLAEIHIKAAFRYAMERDYIERSEVDAIKARGFGGERERYLDEAELRLALPKLAEIGYPEGDAMILALLTGRRLSEIIGAKWAEFDDGLTRWSLPEARTKNRKDGHLLPLAATARRVLLHAREHKIGAGVYVFHRVGSQGKDHRIGKLASAVTIIREAIAPATAQRLEPEQRDSFEFHDTRRTAATWLERLDAPGAVLMEILNHSNKRALGVTSIYARQFKDGAYRLQVLGEWLTKLDQFYASLVPLALPAPSSKAS